MRECGVCGFAVACDLQHSALECLEAAKAEIGRLEAALFGANVEIDRLNKIIADLRAAKATPDPLRDMFPPARGEGRRGS